MLSPKPLLNSLGIKLVIAILVVMVPLVTMLVVINKYAVDLVRNQVAQSNKNLLTLYMERIDQNLTDVDNYLYDLSERNTDVLSLDINAGRDEDEYEKTKLRLFNSILNDINYYPAIDLFFLYSLENKELITIERSVSGYAKSSLVEAEISNLVQGNVELYDNTTWYVWQGEPEYYLFHLVKTGNVYVGAWVNAEKIMVPLQFIEFGKSGKALLAENFQQPLMHADLIREEGIELQQGPGPYHLSGKQTTYMVMGETSKKGNFQLIALIPDKAVLEKLPYLNDISAVISIVACVFPLLFLIIMRAYFLKPISKIIKAMRKLRGGNLEIQLQTDRTSTEFEIMNETFNRMIAQIHELKINVYEEQLNAQRAELKQLQLQVNPHFFLNSLNIIYNLATVKDFTLIQEMSKCLVVYFRYMLRSRSYFVPLKDELEHTRNYLRIQQLRYPDGLTYRIAVRDDVQACDVPPLIIQTIVENSIKHAAGMDDPLNIEVAVELENNGEGHFVVICVKDSGDGFDEYVLNRLQMNEPLAGEEGEQIGIWNVRQRLQLLYKSMAAMEFENGTNGGAVVRIKLPLAFVPDRSGEYHVSSVDRR